MGCIQLKVWGIVPDKLIGFSMIDFLKGIWWTLRGRPVFPCNRFRNVLSDNNKHQARIKR
ncbi:hypothetical protein DRO97_07545 [Archaeoglobales archaeon]|nr:MAG: hypothetical protein DRO97_07545 [Archaeoglobales archaeon]